MYEPSPVGYCVLDPETYECVEIKYGLQDAPEGAVKLYDQYSVQRLLAYLYNPSKQQELPAKEPEEVVQEYNTTLVIKFKDGHTETHIYSNEIEQDNKTIIEQVRKMYPAKEVANVLIVEK